MLPKIDYALNEFTLTSGKKVLYRPLTKSDEKILLIAKESKETSDIFRAMKQVVASAVIDPGFDVDDLPLFELEWLFLHLRIQSIGDLVTLSYLDNEDGKERQFAVSLRDIKLEWPSDTPSNKVVVTDDVTLTLRYPPASLYDNERFLRGKDATEITDEMMRESIVEVWSGDEVFEFKDADRNEQLEFIDSLPALSCVGIQKFLTKSPHISHTIKYVNNNGTERTIPLRSLNDFFIL